MPKTPNEAKRNLQEKAMHSPARVRLSKKDESIEANTRSFKVRTDLSSVNSHKQGPKEVIRKIEIQKK